MRARLLQFIVVAVRVVLLSLPISMSAAMKANGYDVVVCPDTAGLKKYIAERVAHIAQRAISERGVFTIALSGGSMPNLLSELPNQSNVSWSDWRVFFADERCVPLDHDDSNYKACQQNLFDKIPIPPEHIYSIDNIEDPNLAALSYESRLRAVVPGMSLDLAMLGLGPDGHTASLFPGHELLEYNGERAVMPIFDSPKPPSERITLTLSTLRQCKKVVFIAAGEAKAEKVRLILEGHSEAATLPAARVKSQADEATWVLDGPAASQLTISASSSLHSVEL